MNGASHVEVALKSTRVVNSDIALWEREWKTIVLHCGISGLSLTPGMKVLDVGCGGRELSVGAEKRGLHYTGLDIDDGNFDSDPFPLGDTSVDLVVALAFIEHLQSPQNFLNEVVRVLRSGGVLALSTPNWHYASKSFYDNPAHVQPYSPPSLDTLLKAYGFKQVRVVPGLRAKPAWMYRHKLAFQLARYLPFRGGTPLVPRFMSGRTTSMFAFAVG